LTPAQIACVWVLSKHFVTALIVGVTREHQLDQAIATLSIRLNHRMISQLEAQYRPREVMGHE
jgi:1-deoxyxylulose-5-phosphate synthase